MESEVWELETSLIEDWSYIVELMRLFAEHKNTIVEGSSLIQEAD